MKLRDLADIRKGLPVSRTLLVSSKPVSGNYYPFLEADNLLIGGTGRFISEKDLRKLPNYSKRFFIEYGTYLFIIKNGKIKIVRFEETSLTVSSDDIILLQTSIGLVENYLGYEKNRNYVIRCIEDALSKDSDIVAIIGDIDINTDNIRELDIDNRAEQIGIRKPLDKSSLPIRLTQKPLPLDKLMKRIREEELLLETEFQRRPGLWDIGTKSRFIEAMIVRQPIPAFYFDGSDDNKWLVIDGLQRLSTAYDFINNKFNLTELEYLTDLEGKNFESLERIYQRNIEEFEVFAYILENGTPKSVIYKIFKNINTSALKLEGQEIRHAINPGKGSDLLKEVAESDWFKETVALTSRQCERMYDREIVLRFLTFKIRSYREYSPSISEYLDETMTKLYDDPQLRLDEYKNDFKRVLNDIHEVFEEPPFSRSYYKLSASYVHNNIIFELLTYAFSKNKKLATDKPASKQLFINYFKNCPSEFWESEQAYSQSGLFKRFEDIERLISNVK